MCSILLINGVLKIAKWVLPFRLDSMKAHRDSLTIFVTKYLVTILVTSILVNHSQKKKKRQKQKPDL